MKLEHMRLFMEVVESGSISQAAENTFISQQGLSTALKQMEKELQLDLFYRSNKGVTLTDEGKQFYHCCENIMRSYDDFLYQTQELNKSDTFNLYIAINMRNMLPLINEAPFAKKNGWYFNYLERPTDDIISNINERNGIAIFSMFDNEDPYFLSRINRNLKLYALGQETSFVSVCHKDNPIFHYSEKEQENILAQMKCIVSSSPEYDMKHMPEKIRRTICLPDTYSCKEFLKTQNAYALLTRNTYRMHFDPREYIIVREKRTKTPIRYYAVFHLKKNKNTLSLEEKMVKYLQEVLSS